MYSTVIVNCTVYLTVYCTVYILVRKQSKITPNHTTKGVVTTLPHKKYSPSKSGLYFKGWNSF